MWTQIRGQNPQTGEQEDGWRCSLAWLPLLLVENSQRIRQGAAAVEGLRNALASMGPPKAAFPVTSRPQQRLAEPEPRPAMEDAGAAPKPRRKRKAGDE